MIRRGAMAAAAALAARPVAAHGTLEGSGGFYAGALHPVLASEHLLLLIGFGLLLGSRPRPHGAALGALAGGLGVGLGFASGAVAWSASATTAILVAGLAAGVGLAGAARFPRLAIGIFGAGVGLAIGLDTGLPSPFAAALPAIVWACGGVFVGVFLILLNAMALASVATRPPWSIGLRVAGSWIAAASLIVLALELRRLGAFA